MPKGPLRRASRGCGAVLRSGRHLWCLALLSLLATLPALAQSPQLTAAAYADPTTRYPHGVLGDTVEHATLLLTYEGNQQPVRITLPEHSVFEDTAPRRADVDQDGVFEAIVVESHQRFGARLAIYNQDGLMAATPYIGQRFRWLAPIGVTDLDGDGRVELAYIDRPHLAKTLKVWRFNEGKLTVVASLAGLTNHKIGERHISGGIRICDNTPEMIVATAAWQRLMAVTLKNGSLFAQDIGAYQGQDSFTAALSCR